MTKREPCAVCGKPAPIIFDAGPRDRMVLTCDVPPCFEPVCFRCADVDESTSSVTCAHCLEEQAHRGGK